MIFDFRILTTFMCQLQQQMPIMDLPILLAEMVTSVVGTPLDQEYAVSFFKQLLSMPLILDFFSDKFFSNIIYFCHIFLLQALCGQYFMIQTFFLSISIVWKLFNLQIRKLSFIMCVYRQNYHWNVSKSFGFIKANFF